jgi:hypothetical protein
MSSLVSAPDAAFQKARDGLWTSLQRHLSDLQQAQQQFLRHRVPAAAYPFDPQEAEADQLTAYGEHRTTLRNLFIDEAQQLYTLVQALRSKSYTVADKRQLFLLLLGYVDLVNAATEALDYYVPQALPVDEELEEAKARLEKIRKGLRLYMQGIPGMQLFFGYFVNESHELLVFSLRVAGSKGQFSHELLV